MSTASFQYGRPEVALLNLAGVHFARYFELNFSAQCGLSDAKKPGYESASQKINSTLITSLATGNGYIAAGFLGVDEFFSPIQMILDNELISSLNRIGIRFEVNNETLAIDEINNTKHGGIFFQQISH